MEGALDLIRPVPAESKTDLRFMVHDSQSDEMAVFTKPFAAALQILAQIDIDQDHPDPETCCWVQTPHEVASYLQFRFLAYPITLHLSSISRIVGRCGTSPLAVANGSCRPKPEVVVVEF